MSMDMAPTETFRMPPASFVTGRAWFVAFAAPTEMHWTSDRAGSHFPAERRINEIGFETYVPRETRVVVRNRRKHERILPLLGCYLFVRFDRSRDDWWRIRETPGIHDILCNLDMPVRVGDLEIEKLRRAEDAGCFDRSRPMSAFRTGDKVKIMDGPFLDLIAKVRSASPRKRVKLLLNGIKLEIEPEYLAKVA